MEWRDRAHQLQNELEYASTKVNHGSSTTYLVDTVREKVKKDNRYYSIELEREEKGLLKGDHFKSDCFTSKRAKMKPNA